MSQIQFDNSFRTLPEFLYEEVTPTPLKKAKLLHVNEAMKDQLGLHQMSAEKLKQWLNGESHVPGEQRISTRYAGHQFGVWAGQLGDGRAISLGEILTDKHGRQEIQTKGSGLTPFSRMGDGKAVVRSSVREYLCSEAMHGLRIPTTRVLAMLTGEDEVIRETIEPSALIARVFPTNLRFGHFELCFHFDRPAELKLLIEYARETFFDGASTEEMLRDIVERTAYLIAQWMGVGFCHGVMNTDNMSLLGLTIDYGPFGFMEDLAFNYICNHSDRQGRYAYSQQPSIGMWNLERFLVCFVNEVPREKLQQILDGYPAAFEREYMRIAREKLGLLTKEEKDHQLFTSLLRVMSDLAMDYTFIFRQLSHYRQGMLESMPELWEQYGKRAELVNWLEEYDQRLASEASQDEERGMRMRQTNPKYVLKNYIAQKVIEDVEQGSAQLLEQWLEVLYRPFDEHPVFHEYSLPTPAAEKHYVVSCSS